MSSREDVEKSSPGFSRRGRRPPPPGCGPRMGRIRVRFGERGRFTTWADLGREMGIHRDRPWSWEVEGRFPGLDHLTEFLSRLRRIREEGLSPGALAAWVEYGPDDSPPFDEPVNLDDAKDPRRSATAGELVQPTPPTGTRLREAIESAGRADGETARSRFDELARSVELKRMRGEPLSDLESQLAALWPRLRQAIEAAEVLLDEADGTRTRNHRIDRVASSTLSDARVSLHSGPRSDPDSAAA
jgi:hypothetical protein